MDKALESLTKPQLLTLLKREETAASIHREHTQKELLQYRESIAKKEAILSEKEIVILGQKEVIFEKETVISNQQARISTQEKDIALKEKDIALKEKDIALKLDHIASLQDQIKMYKRMIFGQKRERFEGSPDEVQLSLPFEQDPEQAEQVETEITEKITYERKKSKHKGRAKFPKGLPVEEVEIYPDEDTSQMVCIGKEVTEELEYTPAKFFIKRYIRYKYAFKKGAQQEGVRIGALPERVIDKGIPSASLLSMILTDKYFDHLPLYRLKQRFARSNIEIPSSTLEGWVKQALEKLEPLYKKFVFDTKSQGYLQVDETPIKVQDKNKKGSCHQGYYWVYCNPIEDTCLFDYHPTRSAKAPEQMLKDFKGYLQTDGYGVYDRYGKHKGIIHLNCWAHARREFDRALDNDRPRAEKALDLIQKLYAVERFAQRQKLTPEQIKTLRLDHSLPIINEIGKWITEESKKVLPQSRIGKSMSYLANRWDGLSAYLYDGILKIDNNPVENSIRPVALGRKNYLFAGSHEAAQRAAMIYSFFSICKKHEVNPYEWLKHTLESIDQTLVKDLASLYPQNYKKSLADPM